MDADDAVLVVLVNHPRDLEIVRSEHWYRIPAKHAPTHFSHACYLAFYLPKAFGEDKWTIREYAPVRGHELVRRRDLLPGESDHPRADEPYYKLQLGRLIPLPRPIVSRSGRRILFIWTTGEKFSRAVEINDLLGASMADDALWAALKDAGIGAERQMIVHDTRSRYRVDFWIPCTRGELAIILGEAPRRLPKTRYRRWLQFSEEEILTHGDDCIEKISNLVHQLGETKHTMEPSHEHSRRQENQTRRSGHYRS